MVGAQQRLRQRGACYAVGESASCRQELEEVADQIVSAADKLSLQVVVLLCQRFVLA